MNIANYLIKTAFSIEQLWWLLLVLRHFFSLWYITLKFMKIVWHKHNLMISLSVDLSIHMRFPMNTYKGEGTSWGKLNVIASLIWVSFFQIAISLLAYVATFSGQLYFGRSYFFTLFQSNYFDTIVTFSGQLFLQYSCCFVLFHFFRTVTF